MAKQRYSYEKHQRELEKKKKKEQKLRKKQEKKDLPDDPASMTVEDK